MQSEVSRVQSFGHVFQVLIKLYDQNKGKFSKVARAGSTAAVGAGQPHFEFLKGMATVNPRPL